MTKALYLVVLGITLVLFSVSAQEQQAVGGSNFSKNDITYSKEVITPHVPWATKLPQGPIKGFFIPSIQYGRDMCPCRGRQTGIAAGTWSGAEF